MSEEIAGLLIHTGIENTNEFCSVFENEEFHPENLLKRESTINARDCYIRDISQTLWLAFHYDIDGIVSTFNRFSSIKSRFSYLNLLPRKFDSLIPVFSIVKKHLPLNDYSNRGLQYLRWSVSIRLLEGDGFEFHLTLLPVCGKQKFKVYSKKELIDVQYNFFLDFRNNFSCVIQSLPESELARSTIKKNRIFNVNKWFVLCDDREFVLSCLDEALSKTAVDKVFEKKIVAFTFGQRDSSAEVQIKAFDTSDALTTVHAAVTISSPVLDQHLFWSRFSIQDLIGERGVLYSSLSFTSCCNFQTNVDGRSIDISPDLRRLCRIPENLRFLQFYSDTPHLDTNYIHPVFGAVISCGVLHSNVIRSVENKGEEYISLLKENVFKLGHINARFEVVCVAENPSPGFLCADRFINVEQLKSLLERYPLIVPFCNRSTLSSHKSFLDLLRSIPQHLVKVLENLYNDFRRKGGLLNVWRAYQYELASEIFWKGRPHSFIDNIYGNNLGPGGTHPERSKTWEKGFLCLEDCLSCALGESSIPPLTFHSLGRLEKEKIERIFSFVDFLNGSNNVLGVRSVLVLLNDILSDPKRQADCDRSFISDLKQDVCPSWGRLTGAIGISSLAEKLSVEKRYKHPYVFGRAIQLINQNFRDPTAILRVGLYQLKLKYFPDVRLVDKARNMSISWSSNGLLKLVRREDPYTTDKIGNEVSGFTRDIILYLEEQELVFKSKFAPYFQNDPEFSFPWLYDIYAKLGKDYLNREDYIVILAYLTCVGLLQNSWYVDFRKFKKFHSDVHVRNPALLQELTGSEVLSVFTLRIGMNVRIQRLHESLPYMLNRETNHQDKVFEKEQVDEQTNDKMDETEGMTETETVVADLHAVDIRNVVHYDDEEVSRGKRIHCSFGLKYRWSSEELEIVHSLLENKFKTIKAAYVAYQKECKSKYIPDRTEIAFRRKYVKVAADR